MDPQHQPPVPVKKTLLIVNQFITQTTRFLNHFSTLAEEKLQKVFHDVNRIETTLVLLESRLHRLEGFDDMNAAPVTNSALPQAQAVPAAASATSLPAVASGTTPAAPPPSQAAAAPPPPVVEAAPAPPPAPPVVKAKDDATLAPFFKMLRYGAHPQAIKSKMSAAGIDPSLLDVDPEGPSPLGGGDGNPTAVAAPAPAPAAPAPLPAPSLAAPPPRPALMPPPPPVAALPPTPQAPPQAAAAAPPPPPPGGSGTLLRDDPNYGRFFKMLRMGVPLQAAKNKVLAEGLDPDIMDRDPDGPSPFA